jgi:serine protein kinase
MLRAIGEPQTVDTRNDPRLSRLFANKVIKIYPAFAEFYGMEDAIEQVVSYFRHAAQGLEEKKQILYLLGPVGGGKSSIAERLKSLMQEVPFYAIKGSPVNESPLGLFDPDEDGAILEKEYGIPRRYLNRILSPWAVKRLEEFGGDIRKFKVVKRYPSASSSRSASPRPSRATRTTRTSLAWSARSTSASSRPTPRTTRRLQLLGGLCLANQGCSNSSRCSRRRSRCCTRC